MSGPTAQASRPTRDLPQVEGVEHRFVDIGAFRVHVAEAGDGPPLLLLHGWPQHWYEWRKLIPRLASQFRLIAPDLRGFGWSEAPGRGYSPETFAADQVALLDELEIESASVIGHDWGGYTAFLLALGAPERVERMVVLNAPHPWPPVSPRTLLQLPRTWYVVANALPVLGPKLVASRMPAVIMRHGNVHDPFEDGVEVYADRLRDPERAEATSALYRYYLSALARSPRSPWRSERLTVPTLLLFGAKDLYISPEVIEGGEEHGDDFRIELVPDSGHFIAEEKPDLVARRALAFLS
jgi:pimeloyl-ACP methyl ester carboxylesterase